MKEVTVIAPNKVGILAEISESLGGLGVNIDAISAYENMNRGVIRIVTNDVKTAIKALSKVPEVQIIQGDIVVVTLDNRPGELAKLTRKLANRNINIETVYIISKKENKTEVALKPIKEDLEKTKEILQIK